MSKVNIFISSTCYDLSQIRSDLKDFIIGIGHNPILSEEHDFPINPDLTNTENCINAVKNQADIFVLIIGNRYGCTLESGKSITNTEFLTAVEKGIPIYTFTLKQMVDVLPIWEKNPNADFSSLVDDNRIFKFISDVRNNGGLWNFPFEEARDIIDTLRFQLSNLFNESLQVRYKVNKLGNNELYSKISSKALDLIINKEGAYEMKFLMQCFCDEIAKYKYLKNDYKYSILVKSTHRITRVTEFMDWDLLQIGRIQNIVDSFNGIIITAYHDFLKDPGIPSDLDGLYYIAQTYGKLYAELLEWSIEVRSLIVPEYMKEVLIILSKMPESIIPQIEAFPQNSMSIIIKAEKDHAKTENPINESSTLTLSINEEYVKKSKLALDKLERLAASGNIDI